MQPRPSGYHCRERRAGRPSRRERERSAPIGIGRSVGSGISGAVHGCGVRRCGGVRAAADRRRQLPAEQFVCAVCRRGLKQADVEARWTPTFGHRTVAAWRQAGVELADTTNPVGNRAERVGDATTESRIPFAAHQLAWWTTATRHGGLPRITKSNPYVRHIHAPIEGRYCRCVRARRKDERCRRDHDHRASGASHQPPSSPRRQRATPGRRPSVERTPLANHFFTHVCATQCSM